MLHGLILPAVAGHHLPVVPHVHHHRFTGPRVDYIGVLLAAAASWIGVVGVGEAALIAAGIAAAHHKVDITSIVATAWTGAMIGGVIGWLVGLRWGRALIAKPGPLQRFRLRSLEKGEEVYRKRGLMAVYFAPSWMAGISGMRTSRFLPANAAAGLVWACLVGFGAFLIGPSIAEILDDIGTVGVVALVALSVAAFGVRRARGKRRQS